MRPISSKGAVPWLLAVLLAAALPACFAARPADTKEEAEVSGADVGASTDVAGLADADVPQVAADGDTGLPPADGAAEAVDVDGLGDIPAELDGLADVAAEVDGAADAGGDVSPVADAGPEVQGGDAQPGPDVGTDAADSGSDAQACVPASEQCNGKDDDCDGLTDEAGAEVGCLVVASCAKAICVAGACLDVPSASASGPCSDDNACTTGDACVGGSCTGTPKVCKDGEPCTDDGCDVVKGCLFSATSAPCSDGDLCTAADACKAGACVGGGALPCLDNNPCTLDGCDKASGCTFLPASGTCTDGDACTASDSCQGGVCVPGKTATCDDGNACTKDACDKGICSAPPLTGPCDDGDPCTLPGTCSQGKCVLVAKDCNDQDVCTADSCDKVSGSCKHAAVAGCGKAPCGSQGDCKTGKCDVVTHACLGCLVHADCASGQVCKGGACVPGVQCASTSQCKATAQVCDAVGGLCVDCLAESDCGAGKTCLAKACVQKTTCASDTACPAVCAKALGVCAECNVAADCAGKGWCAADHTCHAPVCTAGACQGGVHYACKADGSAFVAVACDDQNPCTTDTCDPAKGCSHPLASQGAACPGGLCDGKGGCKGVVSMATSHASTCAIDKQGQLWCWGNNTYGQLGDGTTINRAVPVQVQGLGEPVVHVAVSSESTCAVLASGQVWCWGYNDSGQLGLGSVDPGQHPSPTAVPGLPACLAVAVTGSASCALGKDGSTWCWGRAVYGETGVGTQGNNAKQPSPQKLVSLGPAQALAAGSSHFCALVSGSVMCWGNGTQGQLGNGQGCASQQVIAAYPGSVPGLKDVVSIAGGSSGVTCAATAGGKAYCWGSNSYGMLGTGTLAPTCSNKPVAAALDQVAAVAGGHQGAMCALRQGGGVWCWGSNNEGELGSATLNGSSTPQEVAGLKGVVQLAGRCAVTADGRPWCWGNNEYGQAGDGSVGGPRLAPTAPVALDGITAFARGGNYHACALAAGGKVWCWGQGGSGRLGDGAEFSRPSPVAVAGLPASALVIAGGSGQTCAALANGSVWCWGDNGSDYSLLGTGKKGDELPKSLKPLPATAVTSAAQDLALSYTHGCALVAGSQLQCWGDNSKGQANPGSLGGVLQVGTGGEFTCARLASGKVRCWGHSSYGEVGCTSCNWETPTQDVPSLSAASHLAVGEGHACVVQIGGAVLCWGRNLEGQIAKKVEQSVVQQTPIPLTVAGLPAASKVFAGPKHTCAIAASGEPWCWGHNISGQLGDGTKSSGEAWKDGSWQPRKVADWTGKAVDMLLGESFTCALRDDGKAFCWGSGGSGTASRGALGDGSAWKTAPTLVKGLP